MMTPSFDINSLAVSLDGWVTDNPDGSRTLTLEFDGPVAKFKRSGDRDFTEIRIDTLTLRRPKSKDLDLVEQIGAKVFKPSRDFVAALAVGPDGVKITTDMIGELDATDLFRAMVVAFGFLPRPTPEDPKLSGE